MKIAYSTQGRRQYLDVFLMLCLASCRSIAKKIGETGEAQGLLHLSHTDGEIRVIAYRNKLIDVPGRRSYVLGFGVDISEQVRAEGRLRTLTRQSDSILESVGDGIFAIDLDGNVTVANAAAAQMLGYKKEEILGRNLHDLIHHTCPDGTPFASEDSPIRKSLHPPRHRPRLRRGLLAQGRHQLPRRVRRPPADRTTSDPTTRTRQP